MADTGFSNWGDILKGIGKEILKGPLKDAIDKEPDLTPSDMDRLNIPKEAEALANAHKDAPFAWDRNMSIDLSLADVAGPTDPRYNFAREFWMDTVGASWPPQLSDAQLARLKEIVGNPGELAAAIKTASQPGGMSFLRSGRDQVDNPYGPNSPQIGGVDPGELAKNIVTKIINSPGYQPVIGPDPFENRGGPTNPYNQPPNPQGMGDSPSERGFPSTVNPPDGGSAAAAAARNGNDLGRTNDSALGNRPDGGSAAATAARNGNDLSRTGGNGNDGNRNDGGSDAGTAARNGNDTNRTGSTSTSTRASDPNGWSRADDPNPGSYGRPIILDLAGTGIAIMELTSSNKFIDSEGTGLLHRTAWAGVGSGVLFYDADGNGAISQKREYFFTEWDPTAKGDLEALRNVFDSNGDGVFDENDDAFDDFRIEVTNADGSTTVMTLEDAGVVSINLTADLTNIAYADGSGITGQTTFTRSDTTTGTVANTTLAADANGYAVVQSVSTDGSGNRVVVNTAYAGDGSIAQVIKTVTSPDGHNITTSFDYNGDGVVDQVQTIAISIDGAGIKTELLTNSDGGGVLQSRIQTVTSADGKTVTISRDSSGAATWFDQSEVRTTHGDGHRTIVITDLNANGSTIRSETTNVSIDGLTRTVSTDLDGSGTADSIVTHVLVIAGSGIRTETITTTNYNTSLRSTTTITTSADGREQTVVSDLDGDTDTDRTDISEITVNGDGTTDSVITVKNGDNSVRSVVTVEQSADSLSSTETRDVNGDSVVDLTITDVMVINGDTSRDHTVSQFNTDTSLRSSVTTHIGADRISKTVEVDSDGNGTTDVEQIVAVDGAGVRTATNSNYNADESLISRSVSTTSADGLSTTMTTDIDGNASTDVTVADVTVLNGDQSSTRTITTTNNDTSLRAKSVIDTSANGLSVTTKSDIDGNGSYDSFTTDLTVSGAGNAWTRTVTEKAGDNSTLLGVTVETQSADRLTRTITRDSNGDGATDYTYSSVEASNGSKTETITNLNPNGSLNSKTILTTSDDGLSLASETDVNGDTISDTKSTDVTVFNSDGSRTRTVEVKNADDSVRSQTVTVVSDDGLTVTTHIDSHADSLFEAIISDVTVLNANGSATETIQTLNDNNSLRSQIAITVSGDGLSRTLQTDVDGNSTFDFTTTDVTVLNTDGSQTETLETRDAANSLRNRAVTTTSDDLRSITINRDVNGDTHNDQVETIVLVSNGTLTDTVSNYNADATLQSRFEHATSDDGLIVTSKSDLNGDSTYDFITTDTTVLNANGSQTRTVAEKSADNTLISQSVTTVSDDGLSTTITWDWNGDGSVDLTVSDVVALSADGSRTETIMSSNHDTSLRDQTVIVTSADQRTVTTTTDGDGNGHKDQLTTRVVANDGSVTTTEQFYSTGEVLISKFTTTTSSNGLTTITAGDLNADGRIDRLISDTTTLGDDGSTEQVIIDRDGHNVLLGKSISTVSDDGLTQTSAIDMDGDGVFEFVTLDESSISSDGSSQRTIVTHDGANALLSELSTTVSDDGLVSSTVMDINGDGGKDRTIDFVRLADGSSTLDTAYYGLLNDLSQQDIVSTSADGRTVLLERDSDGDGFLDQFRLTETDLSQNIVETFSEKANDGTLETRLSETILANGLSDVVVLDVNGDGTTDITRSSSTAYDASGNAVTTFTESYDTDTLAYREVTTASANGYASTSQIDLNGDGVTDETRVDSTTINTDGSQVSTSTTTYADGSLRASSVETISDDGLVYDFEIDRDGNGVMDNSVHREIRSDGQVIETEATYAQSGIKQSVTVTTTSADGLTTTIARSSIDGDSGTKTVVRTETIVRSAISGGSYSWDNGQEATTAKDAPPHIVSTHELDAEGIETWTLESTVLVNTSNPGAPPNWHPVTTTYTHRFDQVALDRLMDAAERLYDAALDRDLSRAEYESLIVYVTNGELDKAALVNSLTLSAEFAVRYGTLSDGEFIAQIYMNALGRPPTLGELDGYLRALSDASMTRNDLAVELSESVEHAVIGNGHVATNNIDLDMNPAVYERLLDEAAARAAAARLVDVVYDREATEQELAQLAHNYLTGAEELDDLVAKLLTSTGDIQEVSSTSLKGLSGAALVEQAFINALGRQPTAEEQLTWEQNLSSGRISNAQFIAALSESVEHMAAGNQHWSSTIITPTAVNGTTGNDTLTGTAAQSIISGLDGNDTLTGSTGSDKLIGGMGIDTLSGGAGNDIYEWTKSNGNDTINDSATSQTESDTLVLTNVTSTGVTLTRSGNDLLVTVTATGEVITVTNRFYSANEGRGIEAIRFSDGVTWNLADIIAKAETNGTAAGETLSGSNYADNLYGKDGNDTLNGSGGDDLLKGGLGIDTMNGGIGNDTYVWSKGDGNDSINDSTTSFAELDTLVLTDVNSNDVLLTRVGNDLKIKIISTNETITVVDRYNATVVGSEWVFYSSGADVIKFADGVVWDLEEIRSNTTMDGTTAGETLTGSYYTDNIYGKEGNDTLNGSVGNDLLVGGAGVDTMNGGDGSDRYQWTKTDGNDTINDSADSLSETDTLILTNVTSTEAVLTRSGNNLLVTVDTEVITIQNRFANPADGDGIEAITFSDGVTWDLQDILAHTKTNGTNSAETLSGSNFDDNIYGKDGNDTINGNDGNDLLVGGDGNDTMNGGKGHDLYEWSKGDDNDTINDNGSTSLTDVDTLALLDVTYGQATLAKSGVDLTVTVSTGGIITVLNRFDSGVNGYGVEFITFSDGVVVEVLDSPVAEVITTGTASANTLSGWSYRDTIYGLEGNDTINGNNGDDLLVGGAGVDTMNGGNGNDTYRWATGEGSDTLTDSATSLTEIDTLLFTDVASTSAVLTRSGNNLLVTIGTEVITVTNRFYSVSEGRGIETISFSDGVMWNLQDILAKTWTNGTTAGETLTGSNYSDNLDGKGGNDTLNGNSGDDLLVGGAGVDTMNGGAGTDRYEWTAGDGNDTIDDTTTSLTDTDTLVLNGILPSNIVLKRIAGDGDALYVQITTAMGVETLYIRDQFDSDTPGRGIESIIFADGTVWNLEDILAHTTMTGTTGVDSLTGSIYGDNIYGLQGNDTINGNNGDDLLVGGAGVDTMNGGNGNDTYQWSRGEGSDTITDSATSLAETDMLELLDAASTDVVLTRSGNNLLLTVTTGVATEVITVTNRFYSTNEDRGVEVIKFSDGVMWTLADILTKTWTIGTAAGETLSGSNYADNIDGKGGNDTLNGNNGDDVLVGGTGADTLNGGSDIDTVSYENAIQGVKVDLAVTTGQTGYAGGEEVGDILSNIESLKGSTLNDWLAGNDYSNVILAGSGNDTLFGRDGYDTIYGQDGNDLIDGGLGADLIDGGAGTDEADYSASTAAVTVDLATGTGLGGYAEGDVLVDIENINGSSYNDVLKGNGGANLLRGNGGSDQLTGGAGNDTLTGGLGNDTFYFAADFGQDMISDFQAGTGVADIISLSLGSAFDSYAEVIAVASQVGADTVITIDGSNTITLTGVLASALVADDFAFV